MGGLGCLVPRKGRGDCPVDILLSGSERLHPVNRCWIFQRLGKGDAGESEWESEGTYAFDVPFGVGLMMERPGLESGLRSSLSEFASRHEELDAKLGREVAEACEGHGVPKSVTVRGHWRLRPDGKQARSWILERLVGQSWSTVSYPASLGLAAKLTREADLRAKDGAQDLPTLMGTVSALNYGFLEAVREAVGSHD